MNAVGWQYKFIDLTTGRAKSVKVNEIRNRNSKCSWFIPDCDLVDLYWTYFSVGVDVLLIDDAHLIYQESGELGVKSKEKKKSHLPSAAEGFFQEGACSIIFLPFTLSFTPSHSCKHLFQAASQVKQQKCHQSKKSQCPLEDVPYSRQHHSSPQSGGNLSVVEMDIDKQTAESNDGVNQDGAPQGWALGPEAFVSWQRHNARPLGGGLLC